MSETEGRGRRSGRVEPEETDGVETTQGTPKRDTVGEEPQEQRDGVSTTTRVRGPGRSRPFWSTEETQTWSLCLEAGPSVPEERAKGGTGF